MRRARTTFQWKVVSAERTIRKDRAGRQIYLVRTDHIGRPSFATTSAGTVVWTASYLPFGGVHVTTGAPIDLRFPGQWFQAEAGLHQNWMRDYDPTTGRYVQADPLGLVDGASVYGYARQSPLRWTDPRGECIGPSFGVCVFLGFLIYDILTDEDDCYTLEDYGWFVLDYFMPGPRLKPMMKGPSGGGGGGGGGPEKGGNQCSGPACILVDSKGNAIPLKPGERVTGSPDGTWIQVRDADGNPTGMRKDGPHNPNTHADPRAQVPHAHVPGVKNSDGTPWLPLR